MSVQPMIQFSMCSSEALNRLTKYEFIFVYSQIEPMASNKHSQEISNNDAVFLRMARKPRSQPLTIPAWTFLTNHGPEKRLRDVAARVGITVRAVQRIIRELEEARYLQRKRQGRRNRYEFRPNLHLRHPVEGHRTIGELIDFVIQRRPAARSVSGDAENARVSS
jgi:predicted transcriptional regulator